MTIEEIRKNAPDGATHYFKRLDYVSYWMKDGLNYSCWSELFLIWVNRKNLHQSRITIIDELKPLN